MNLHFCIDLKCAENLFFFKGTVPVLFEAQRIKRKKTNLNQTKTDFHRWQSLKEFQCHNVFFSVATLTNLQQLD